MYNLSAPYNRTTPDQVLFSPHFLCIKQGWLHFKSNILQYRAKALSWFYHLHTAPCTFSLQILKAHCGNAFWVFWVRYWACVRASFFFPTRALDEALFVFAKSMHFPYWVAPQPSKHSTFWLHHQLVIFSSAWHYFNTTLWPRVGKVPFFKIILANGPEMSWPCAQKTSLTSPIENVVETWYPGIQITFCHSANTVHSDDVAS